MANIISILIFLILFLNENAFYLVSNTSFCQPLSFLLCIVLIMYTGIKINKDNRDIFKFSVCYIIVAMISAIYTVVTNMQSIEQAFIKYLPCMNTLFCVSFLSSNTYRKTILRNNIISLGTSISIVFILQSILYPNVIFVNAVLYRDGARIMTGGVFFAISFIVTLDSIFRFEKKKKNVLCLLLTAYNIIFVNQSRSVILAIIFSTGVYILCCFTDTRVGRNFNSKISRQLTIICVSIILAIWLFSYVRNLFYSSYSIGESSSIKRLQAYEYYYGMFCNQPVLGIGMIRNQLVDGLATIGVTKKLFVDDIGIVGFIAQWGLFGIFTFLLWIRAYFSVREKSNRQFNWAILSLLLALLPFNFMLNMNYGILYSVVILILVSDKRNSKGTFFYREDTRFQFKKSRFFL